MERTTTSPVTVSVSTAFDSGSLWNWLLSLFLHSFSNSSKTTSPFVLSFLLELTIWQSPFLFTLCTFLLISPLKYSLTYAECLGWPSAISSFPNLPETVKQMGLLGHNFVRLVHFQIHCCNLCFGHFVGHNFDHSHNCYCDFGMKQLWCGQLCLGVIVCSICKTDT